MQFQKISIFPPQKRLEFPGGGGSVRPKNLKKHMKLNWNFQRGGEGILEKIPSVGEVRIFSGITHLNHDTVRVQIGKMLIYASFQVQLSAVEL